MLARTDHQKRLGELLRQFPVVGLIGARQAGKSTLARSIVATRRGPVAFFDLEDPTDAARLQDPMLALRQLEGLFVIDEIQHSPRLFEVLGVLADRPGSPTRFLVLGSAGPQMLRQSSESLAGRIAYHVLPPISLGEAGVVRLTGSGCGAGFPGRCWPKATRTARPGFPRSFVRWSSVICRSWA